MVYPAPRVGPHHGRAAGRGRQRRGRGGAATGGGERRRAAAGGRRRGRQRRPWRRWWRGRHRRRRQRRRPRPRPAHDGRSGAGARWWRSAAGVGSAPGAGAVRHCAASTQRYGRKLSKADRAVVARVAGCGGSPRGVVRGHTRTARARRAAVAARAWRVVREYISCRSDGGLGGGGGLTRAAGLGEVRRQRVSGRRHCFLAAGALPAATLRRCPCGRVLAVGGSGVIWEAISRLESVWGLSRVGSAPEAPKGLHTGTRQGQSSCTTLRTAGMSVSYSTTGRTLTDINGHQLTP